MRYKVGVRVPADVDQRMFIAIDAIERAWETFLVAAEPVITHWQDGVHGLNSYHKRRGRAVDVRTKTIPRELVPALVIEVQKRIAALGFDVVLEDFNGDEEHLHVELDKRADLP